MTGFLLSMHFLTSSRCVTGIRSAGISTPRSPRATMIPYVSSSISSILSTPSLFSIFEMILIELLRSLSIFLTAKTSDFFRTNEWAMKSISMVDRPIDDSWSLSVTEGRSIGTPGMFTLLRGLITPPLCTSQTSSSSVLSTTCSSSSPSSIRMIDPVGTASYIVGSFRYIV